MSTLVTLTGIFTNLNQFAEKNPEQIDSLLGDPVVSDALRRLDKFAERAATYCTDPVECKFGNRKLDFSINETLSKFVGFFKGRPKVPLQFGDLRLALGCDYGTSPTTVLEAYNDPIMLNPFTNPAHYDVLAHYGIQRLCRHLGEKTNQELEEAKASDGQDNQKVNEALKKSNVFLSKGCLLSDHYLTEFELFKLRREVREFLLGTKVRSIYKTLAKGFRSSRPCENAITVDSSKGFKGATVKKLQKWLISVPYSDELRKEFPEMSAKDSAAIAKHYWQRGALMELTGFALAYDQVLKENLETKPALDGQKRSESLVLLGEMFLFGGLPELQYTEKEQLLGEELSFWAVRLLNESLLKACEAEIDEFEHGVPTTLNEPTRVALMNRLSQLQMTFWKEAIHRALHAASDVESRLEVANNGDYRKKRIFDNYNPSALNQHFTEMNKGYESVNLEQKKDHIERTSSQNVKQPVQEKMVPINMDAESEFRQYFNFDDQHLNDSFNNSKDFSIEPHNSENQSNVLTRTHSAAQYYASV